VDTVSVEGKRDCLAHVNNIKFDPQRQSAIFPYQDPNLALEMQSIETGLQIRRAKADHDLAITDQPQKLNTHSATLDEYVEHAAENTCFSVLSIISQSVGPDNFDTLTQIAR
jgi:hypothetical protein